jgi:putative ABC transport system ATP-binding protein
MEPEVTHNIVALSRITKTYGTGDAKLTVLRGLDFVVRQNEFLCLWGTSGSGKSTLLNLIGMIDDPDEGEVQVAGKNISALDDNQKSIYRNEAIGFIFQSFNLIPVLSVLENVMLTLQIRGVPEGEAREKSRAMLALLGLDDHTRKRPDQISGGQRQRVAIARALVGEPLLVLADEPTANLDSKTGEQILEIMKQMCEEQSVTFIFSTHDPKLLAYATRNVHLVDGRIVEDAASPRSGFALPRVEAA